MGGLRVAAGMAVAASVAVAVVTTAPLIWEGGDPAAPQLVADIPINRPGPAVQTLREQDLRWKGAANPELDARINGYLVEHSGYASTGGVLPYATFVSYGRSR